MRGVVLALHTLSALQICWALDNGLALAPPMGINTWNVGALKPFVVANSHHNIKRSAAVWLTACCLLQAFHDEINETLIRQTADLMVSLGLRASGYTYINLDGAPSRNAKRAAVWEHAHSYTLCVQEGTPLEQMHLHWQMAGQQGSATALNPSRTMKRDFLMELKRWRTTCTTKVCCHQTHCAGKQHKYG